MKIIDLLNKIANGEIERGYKFQHRNKIVTMGYLLDNYLFLEILNDEVEILEEEPRDIEVCGSLFTKSEYDKLAQSEEEKKIPEKLKIELNSDDENKVNYYRATNLECDLAFKINSIIDYLKSKGE